MPGKKSKLNQGFRSVFHIPEVKRGPVRKRVLALGRVNKLVKSTEALALIEKWNQAHRLANDKLPVNDDTARLAAKTEAERLCTELERDLPLLETAQKAAAKEKPVKVPLKGRKPIAHATDYADNLKETLNQELSRIDPKTKTGKQVLATQDALSISSLKAQAQGLKLQVDAEVIDSARQVWLDEQLATLQANVLRAEEYSRTVNARALALNAPGNVVARAQALKARFESEKRAGVDQLPFVTDMNALIAATAGSELLNLSGIERLAAVLEKSLLAAAADPGGYADIAKQQRDREKVELVAYNDLVKDPLNALRVLAQPLGLVSFTTHDTAASLERVAIVDMSKPCAPGDGNRRGAARAAAIERDMRVATQEANDMRALVKQLRAEVATDIEAVKATRATAVFTIDWLAIDAGLASIDALMPADSAAPGEVMDSVVALKALVPQLKARVAVINAKKADAALFEGKMTKLRTAMLETVKDKGLLGSWAKASADELTAERRKLRSDLPKLNAEAALARLAKLQQAYDDKIAEIRPVDDYVKAKQAQIQGWTFNYSIAASELAEGGVPAEPNAMLAALAAWEGAQKARPVVKTSLEAAYAACDKAFAAVDAGRNVADVAGDSHADLARKAKDAAAIAKLLREKLEARRYGLKQLATGAAAEVEGVKGDSQPIDEINRHLATAKSLIESGDEPGATRVMNIISNRLGLVLGNLPGEKVRRRDELQPLFDEWADVAAKARASLQVVLDKVNEHAAAVAVESRGKVEKLARAVTDYRAEFAADPSALRTAFASLATEETPEAERRKAREQVLAHVADALRRMKAHPLTADLAASPVAAARGVPGSLVRMLDRLNFTISISVE